MVLSLFHGVDNILECILFVLICTQYMLSSSSYVLYVPKSILSVLPYKGVGDFTKREMKLTLILTFKYHVFDRTKKLPLFVTITAGLVGPDISGRGPPPLRCYVKSVPHL